MSSPRVVITGIGMLCPAGTDRESAWARIQHGPSATRLLHISGFAEPIAGAALPESWNSGSHERVVALALAASCEAAADARLDFPRLDRDRIGCVIGTSKGGLRSFSELLQRERGASREEAAEQQAVRELLWREFLPTAASATVAGLYDLRGPALCPVAACATGLVSVLRGADLIRQGVCDRVLAGSVDASLQPAVLASFRRLGVLAPPGSAAERACRPFDQERAGFVIGEGGAVFVLESLEAALERGVRPYAEWLSGETAADPHDLMRMSVPSRSLVRLIRETLRLAGMEASQIDYINLHGTGTWQNDPCESQAVEEALGPLARRIACSSLKGGLGHLLGAAGSVELAATILALRDQWIPATLNLERPDEMCRLDYTPEKGRPASLRTALKLSLGFGGHLAAAVVRRWED